MTLVHIHPMNQALVINNIPIQIELTFSKEPIKINSGSEYEISTPHKIANKPDKIETELPLTPIFKKNQTTGNKIATTGSPIINQSIKLI